MKKKKDETLTTLIFFFQMGLLIEELGLTQVLSTRVGRLTTSELKRLSIACCLMSSADILLLDSPTIFMDIFDTFFLVEFLRGWASGGPGNMEQIKRSLLAFSSLIFILYGVRYPHTL